MSSHAGGRNAGMWVFPDTRTAARDMVAKITARSSVVNLVLIISGVLLALGIVGFIIKAASFGFDETGPWGYYMAVFAYIFMITSGAPLVAVAFRFTKSHWRRPLSRVAELFSIIGIFNIIIFIPMMLVLPDIQNLAYTPGAEGELAARRSIWLGLEGVPLGAPHWWDMLGMVSLAVTSLTILWLSLAPDMAQARASTTGFRRTVYTILSKHWYGTKRQWIHQKVGLSLLGAFYFMMFIFVQFLIVSDYAMSLVPGWKDSILPPLNVIMSLQCALGLILIIMFIMRRWGGYREYIGVSLFWSASKVLLGLTLLWTYHLFAFFITFWYGRLEVEQNIIRYFIFESYAGVFWIQMLFTFLLPFLLLIWNPIRRSDWGPPLAGLFALFGAFLYHIRTFVGAFNAGDIYDLALSRVPVAVSPDPLDFMIMVGGLGGVVFIYMLAARLFPILSIWELKEGAMYQHMRPFMRGQYLVLAKPE